MHINSSLSFNSKFNKIISPSLASLMVTLKKMYLLHEKSHTDFKNYTRRQLLNLNECLMDLIILYKHCKQLNESTRPLFKVFTFDKIEWEILTTTRCLLVSGFAVCWQNLRLNSRSQALNMVGVEAVPLQMCLNMNYF